MAHESNSPQNHVVVIGGGFSGTLLALNLLRYEGASVTLVERRDRAGSGLAYGFADPDHLLNVRAAKMSAYPDQHDHFVSWLRQREYAADDSTFVPRAIYGRYIGDLLEAALHAHVDRLSVVYGSAREIDMEGADVRVSLEDGSVLTGSQAVLAVGNLPPHAPPGLPDALSRSERYVADPWAENVAHGLAASDRILILGTGLTMVDTVLRLRSKGFGGAIVAMSRRGLLPHRHDVQSAYDKITEKPRGPLSVLVRTVRQRATAVEWRNAVDELRPFTQSLWQAANEEERARFLRHLRPWWDIHRHRIAPSVADRIEGEIANGGVQVVAARPLSFSQSQDGVEIAFRPRSSGGERSAAFSRVINCMGPQGDLTRTRDPLLRWLSDRESIRPDAARLGIDVDSQSRVLNAAGVASDRLLAVGPITRGAFWEISAVPDIRMQVWALARRLSNAHWVEGEGL